MRSALPEIAVLLLALSIWPAVAANCPQVPYADLPKSTTSLLVEIGECAFAADDLDSAISAYSEAAERGDTFAMAGLAEALGLRDRPEDRPRAIAALSKLLDVLAREPKRFELQIAKYKVDLADLLRRDGRDQDAVQAYDDALAIASLVPDTLDDDAIAIVLHNRGVSLEGLARYVEALDAYRSAQAIRLPESTTETARKAKLLLNVGVVNWKLGDNEQAEEGLRAAALALQQTGDDGPLASALNNLGLVLAWTKRYNEAADALHKSLDLRERAFGMTSLEVATSANNLGVVLTLAARYDEAAAFLERAIAIARFHDSPMLAQATDTRAENELRRGNRIGALSDSLAAIDIWRRDPVANSDDLRQAYERSASILKDQGYDKAAAAFAKLGVNAHQQVKRSNEGLSNRLSQKLAASYADLYYDLIDTYAGDGAFAEAQFVGDLLKQREFQHFFDSQFVPEAIPNFALPLSPQESAFEGTLLASRQSAEGMFNAARDFERESAGPITASATPDDLGAFAKKHGIAALQIMPTANTLHLFLTKPDATVAHRRITIERAQLARLIHSTAAAVESGQIGSIDRLRQLYDLLIKPMEVELEATGADTLLLSVGGFIRYVPFAALSSGNRFLIEDYAIAYRTPAVNLIDTTAPRVAHGAGFGMTLPVGGFPALPGAGAEIESLFAGTDEKGVLGGPSFIDSAFTASSLAETLAGRPPYLHIASHFRFRPDEPNQSFLLLGDRSGLTLDRIRKDARFRFDGVNLLVLSACATARAGGDGSDVESLGVTAQANGAASVMATLWPIEDEATVGIMTDFYRGLAQDNLGKARALQAAQIGALRNGVHKGRASARSAEVMVDTNVDSLHPKYWAPFIVMGDWR